MKIAIVASGSRGDVQPYVALGQGLRGAGHAVRVITSDDFDTLVTGAGLEFTSTGQGVEQMLQSKEWREVIEKGNFLVILSRMNAEMKRRGQDMGRRLPALLDGAELIITGMGGISGTYTAAAHRRIPVIQAYVVPFTPTSAFAIPLLPDLPLPPALKRGSFHLMHQMFWQTSKQVDASVRRELGMRKGSFWGPFRALNQNRVPALYGYSQHVLPRPHDWPENHYVTGYWFVDVDSGWLPPPDLQTFLDAGEPPVYIGFGSMGSRSPEEAGQIALEALQRTGQRGVLASGWGGLHANDLPQSIHLISSIPHSWLFPRMAAVVHHGGAGTTAAGLRAGVPSILIPFMGDQPFWGRRVTTLGVGPEPIPRKKLTAARLADAITRAVSDHALRQRAADLGTKIRAENGLAAAVNLIEHLKQHPVVMPV